MDYILHVYKMHEADMACKLYRNLLQEPWAATFWGCLFERQVLAYFNHIGTTHELSIRWLTDSYKMPWTYHGPISLFTFLQDEIATDEIKNAVEANKSLYLVPSVSNFPSIDLIIYDLNEVLTYIQITISMTHDINVSGLQHIQKWLKHSMLVDELCPLKRRQWHFIFIVLLKIAPKFELQMLKGEGLSTWPRKMDQYVLGLKEKTIFRMKSKSGTIISEQGELVRC